VETRRAAETLGSLIAVTVKAMPDKGDLGRPLPPLTLRDWLQRLAIGIVVLGLATLGMALSVAWPYSDNLVKIGHGVAYYEKATLAASDRVRLPSPGEADWPGRFELAWDGGYGEIGPIVSRGDGFVVRTFTARQGTLAPNTPVRVDTYFYEGDPRSALGLDFRTVEVHDRLGDFPTWYVPAGDPRTTWFLFVHGHNGYPKESLRYIKALHAAGVPVLVPTYRNDVGAPASADGVSHLGDTEWQDIAAAMHWALDHGARDIVLAGNSMGGTIALQAADRADVKDHVRGVVLDSPVLTWGKVLPSQAVMSGIPPIQARLAMVLLRLRYGIDFSRFDWPARGKDLRVPVLIFHSDQDGYISDAPDKELAAERPDLVTLELLPGAGHTQGWNQDPAGYERRLVDWLAAHGAVRAPAEASG
jgi:pimeloyl-ACP methyl ester carboxylesterase